MPTRNGEIAVVSSTQNANREEYKGHHFNTKEFLGFDAIGRIKGMGRY